MSNDRGTGLAKVLIFLFLLGVGTGAYVFLTSAFGVAMASGWGLLIGIALFFIAVFVWTKLPDNLQ